MWISKKKYDEIVRRVDELNKELQRLYNTACLVDVKRDGMKVVMTFCQGDRMFTVEAVQVFSGGKEIGID